MRACIPVAAAMLLAVSTAHSATFLNGSAEGGLPDVVIVGEPSSGLGSRTLVGDVNRDGRHDLVVEAETGRFGALVAEGSVHVFFGRSDWPATWDLGLQPADVTFGPVDARDTLRLIAIGDVNRDTQRDLVLMATKADGPGNARYDAGELYIWFGRATWPALVTPSTLTPDVTILGTASAPLSTQSGLADLNGDGVLDLQVVTTGPTASSTHSFLGRPTWPALVDLSVDAAAREVRGLPTRSGEVEFGDVSGDGLADVVFTEAGSVRVILGEWPPADTVHDHVAADADVTITTGGFQLRLENVGGDATLDVVMTTGDGGTPPRRQVQAFEGGARLAEARALGAVVAEDENDDLRPGPGADVNRDGIPDLVTIARGRGPRDRMSWNDSLAGVGEVVVILGPPPARVDLNEGFRDVVIWNVGLSAAGLAMGDLDGDGRPDLVTGEGADKGTGHAPYAGFVTIFLEPFDLTPSGALRTIHVDASRPDDGGDGWSWATAKKTIGAGLEALDAGPPGQGSVLVAEGTYREQIRVGEATRLFGGYPSGGGTRLDRNPSVHVTTIDAQFAGRAVELIPDEDVGEVVLDGFRVTGGRATVGGGVLTSDLGIVRNCVIAGNKAVATVEAVTDWCYDTSGGVQPFNNLCDRYISGLGTGTYGGRIHDSLVIDNEIEFEPDWFCIEPPAGYTCYFVNDDRLYELWGVGGGIYGAAEVLRSTVSRNQGDGVRMGSYDTMRDSIAFGNGVDFAEGLGSSWETPYVEYSLIGTTVYGLNATVERQDPRFVNPGGEDYHLSQTASGQAQQSIAVNAGSMNASAACQDAIVCLDAMSTRTDGGADTGRLDMGYHYYAVPVNRAPAFAAAPTAAPDGDCALRVSWSDATDPEDDSPVTYRVYRGESPGPVDFGSPLATLPSSETTWLDTTVRANADYAYVVRATDSLGLEDSNVVAAVATVVDGTPPQLQWSGMSRVGCDVTLEFGATDACSGVALLELHRSTFPGFVPDATTLVATDPVSPHLDVVPANERYYYRLVAEDASGTRGRSRQLSVRIATCSGPEPPPGEARIMSIVPHPLGMELTIEPAEGAAFHVAFRGTLVPGGLAYDHSVSIGTDRLADTSDDVGSCGFLGTTVIDPTGLSPGSFYWVVVGVNDAGEGVHGLDSEGSASADETTGVRDCP